MEATDEVAAPRRWATLARPGVIFALAATVRVSALLLSRGGITRDPGYDQSVYYAAADSFLHGRMPYRDFVLLHPPGVMLALTPFAALGRATTDLTGFAAGNLAFALLGSLNAALVYLIARRLGLSTLAASIGGVFYAVWFGAVYAELTSRLEPLGSFAFLCGVLALVRARPERPGRSALLAGVGLGCALSVKAWWLAPLIVIAIWLACRRGGLRRAGAYLGGVALALVVVDGPFFAMAPSQMFHMVGLDQLGRNAFVARTTRLGWMSTLEAVQPLHGRALLAAAALFVVVLGGVCLAAWQFRPARLFVVLAVLQAFVLVAAPPFFHFYVEYLAASFAIVVAAAAHARGSPAWVRVRRGILMAVVAGAACVTILGSLARPVSFINPFPADALADDLPASRCVMALSPLALIELDALTKNLDDGCPQWVDATGRTYTSLDPANGKGRRSRAENLKWQTDLRNYLFSGNAFVLIGIGKHAFSRATLAAINRNELIIRDHGVLLYEVEHGADKRTDADDRR